MSWIKRHTTLCASVSAALCTLLLYGVLPYNSRIVEVYFSTGLFTAFRFIWDHTFARLPVPLIYILVILLIYYVLRPLWEVTKRRIKFARVVQRVIIVFSVLITMFYWMWGFNYKRIDVRERLGLVDFDVDTSFLFQEYDRVSDTLGKIRLSWPEDFEWRAELLSESKLRDDLEDIYNKMEIPYAGRVNIRKLQPRGTLLHWSTAGVYLPWVGEGQIDAGLHPITHPFTMSHEMSHGYGWTGEDVCNFLALMACVNSDNTYYKYSGYLGYWRYLRNNAYRANPEKWKAQGELVSRTVLEDYKNIMAYANRYPDILPRLRDLFYDSYLKSHGIPQGLVSYSEIIKLSYAWQEKYGSLIFH